MSEPAVTLFDQLRALGFPRFLTRAQLAKLLGVDISTLARWAGRGVGPKCIWLEGQTIRYDLVDVAEYLQERKSA